MKKKKVLSFCLLVVLIITTVCLLTACDNKSPEDIPKAEGLKKLFMNEDNYFRFNEEINLFNPDYDFFEIGTIDEIKKKYRNKYNIICTIENNNSYDGYYPYPQGQDTESETAFIDDIQFVWLINYQDETISQGEIIAYTKQANKLKNYLLKTFTIDEDTIIVKGDFVFNIIYSRLFYDLLDIKSVTDEQGLHYFDEEKETLLWSDNKKSEITLPQGTKKILPSAFNNCYNLTKITLNEDLKEIGHLAFSNCYNLTNITIPQAVEEVGMMAFGNCYNIVEMTFGSANMSFSRMALMGCSNLRKINIPSIEKWCQNNIAEKLPYEYELYYNGNSIEDLIIPSTVEEITKGAFANYKNLTSLTIPNSVKLIEEEAFSGCEYLRNVNIDYGVKTIGEYAFDGCKSLEEISLPDTIKSIAEGTFNNCSKLKTVNLTEGVKSIGNYAFANCPKIKNINMPKSLESMGYDVFDTQNLALNIEITNIDDWCKNNYAGNLPTGYSLYMYDNEITNVYIYNNVNNKAFKGCSSITTVNIADSVEKIGNEAFANCKNLQDVSISSSVNAYGRNIFNNSDNVTVKYIVAEVQTLEQINFPEKSLVKEVSLPETLLVIGEEVFNNFISLETINIPYSLQEIQDRAFANCISLANIDLHNGIQNYGEDIFEGCYRLNVNYNYLPNTVNVAPINSQIVDKVNNIIINSTAKNIEARAFANCILLQTIIIPDSVVQIKERAFEGCYNLTEVSFGKSLNNIGGEIFSGCDALQQVVFNSAVTQINYDALPTSQNIEYTIVADNNTCLYTTSLAQHITKITFAEGTTNIKENAFRGCYNVDEVVFNDSITNINSAAFKGCTSIRTINLPVQLQRLSTEAFIDCNNLRTVYIHQQLQYIESNVFNYSSGIYIYCEIYESQKPTGWVQDWDCSNYVYWDYYNY